MLTHNHCQQKCCCTFVFLVPNRCRQTHDYNSAFIPCHKSHIWDNIVLLLSYYSTLSFCDGHMSPVMVVKIHTRDISLSQTSSQVSVCAFMKKWYHFVFCPAHVCVHSTVSFGHISVSVMITGNQKVKYKYSRKTVQWPKLAPSV